jgi:DNA-binding NtrC family response regulator
MKDDRPSSLMPPLDAPDAEWPTLEDVMQSYLTRALERSGGRKGRAAEILGVDRRTVNRMLARRDKSGQEG